MWAGGSLQTLVPRSLTESLPGEDVGAPRPQRADRRFPGVPPALPKTFLIFGLSYLFALGENRNGGFSHSGGHLEGTWAFRDDVRESTVWPEERDSKTRLYTTNQRVPTREDG